MTRNGMFKAVDRFTSEIVRRYWLCVDKHGSLPPGKPRLGECWFWTGKIMPSGYGSFSIGKMNCIAHGVAWELINGRIPDDEPVVRHLCNVRHCVRPTHLKPGTQKENIIQMVEDGRWGGGGPSGELASRAVLTAEAVQQFRAEYRNGDISIREIAERYGVGMSTVRAAITGASWGHIDGSIRPIPIRHLTNLEKEDIRIRAQNGIKASALAIEYGTSPTSISRIVRHEEHQPRTKKTNRVNKRLSKINIEQIKDKILTGIEFKFIAEEFGCHYGTVSRISRDAFHKPRGGARVHERKLTDDQIQEIRVKLNKGMLQRLLAAEYNVDLSLISRINTGEIRPRFEASITKPTKSAERIELVPSKRFQFNAH